MTPRAPAFAFALASVILGLYALDALSTPRVPNATPPAPAQRAQAGTRPRAFVLLLDSLRYQTVADAGFMPRTVALRAKAVSARVTPTRDAITVPAIRAAFSGRDSTSLLGFVRNFVKRSTGHGVDLHAARGRGPARRGVLGWRLRPVRRARIRAGRCSNEADATDEWRAAERGARSRARVVRRRQVRPGRRACHVYRWRCAPARHRESRSTAQALRAGRRDGSRAPRRRFPRATPSCCWRITATTPRAATRSDSTRPCSRCTRAAAIAPASTSARNRIRDHRYCRLRARARAVAGRLRRRPAPQALRLGRRAARRLRARAERRMRRDELRHPTPERGALHAMVVYLGVLFAVWLTAVGRAHVARTLPVALSAFVGLGAGDVPRRSTVQAHRRQRARARDGWHCVRAPVACAAPARRGLGPRRPDRRGMRFYALGRLLVCATADGARTAVRDADGRCGSALWVSRSRWPGTPRAPTRRIGCTVRAAAAGLVSEP